MVSVLRGGKNIFLFLTYNLTYTFLRTSTEYLPLPKVERRLKVTYSRDPLALLNILFNAQDSIVLDEKNYFTDNQYLVYSDKLKLHN